MPYSVDGNGLCLLGWAELEELEAIIEKQWAANQKKS
jgi:hypothetical protein